MMKSVIISALLLVSTALTASAQNGNTTICRLGFTYDISQCKNWGNNKPVIKSVIPYSSAEQAGIKKNDVIEEINGVPVTAITTEEVEQALNPAGKNEVVLTIRNLASDAKQVLVKKECKKSNAITEDQLATAYSMYSLETTHEREFICPFKTTVTADSVDFVLFNSFAFSSIDENNRELETVINECIRGELTQKGLIEDFEKPDLLVQTFYFFDKNPNYMGANKIVVSKEPVYRYNFSQSKMEKFPFLNSAAAEAEAKYLLQFGIRFIDQKIEPGRVLWESEANELLEDSYKLDEYARVHIPLMCMQYPYAKYTRNVPFKVNRKTYNYTGISYNIDKLDEVVSVDKNSPAYAAGIRPQDIVEKIGRNKMSFSAEEFSAGYKRFITRTMCFRDPSTIYTDANGFRYCMLWDIFKYPQIADAAQEADFLPAFTYLYYFAPYINPSGNNACTFIVRRGKNKSDIIIRPTIRSEVVVEIK